MLPKHLFGHTGLSVSPLGFGAAPIGFLKTEQDAVARMLNYLLDNGVNVIDTAAMYEGSEALIGQAVSHRRAEYILISKCGTRVKDIDAPLFSASLVSKTVERALRNLKTDFLDVMLLHSCDLKTLQHGEALGALVKAGEQGKIKFAGYSGDNEAAAFAASLRDVAVIETSVNLADQANISKVLPVTQRHNIGVIAKRPIANAAWKQTSEQPGFYGKYAEEYHNRLAAMKLDPQALGCASWHELALRYTLSQEGVHTAIIGTTNPENAKKNLHAAAQGKLPASAIVAINAGFETARAGRDWPGQQ